MTHPPHTRDTPRIHTRHAHDARKTHLSSGSAPCLRCECWKKSPPRQLSRTCRQKADAVCASETVKQP
eukprot:1078219-Pyramimonas_sp.AAC.1